MNPNAPFVLAALALAFGAGSAGCRSHASTTPKPSASAPAALAPVSQVVFSAHDGMPLRGVYAASADPAAPLVVLVHAFRGSSAEWRPLVERLAAAPRPCSVLSFDLRGHGESTVDAHGARTDWTAIAKTQVPDLVWDIHAAIDYGLAASGGRAAGVVLVGSSQSAALAAQVAREQPKVVALGLISPGDMLEGYDVFHRYHAVRELPAFVATGTGDTVALEPAKIIARLGGDRVTLQVYPGSGHGPAALTRTDDKLWRDLEAWIGRVKSERPRSRAVVARGSPPDFSLPVPVPTSVRKASSAQR